MIAAGIAGVAIWGPGLAGWQASLPQLRGEPVAGYPETVPPAPAMLPPNERRRSSLVVRLALQAAAEAASMSGIRAADLRPVFGSSNGDGAIVHGILEAIAAETDLSPTAFHNSVHNAAAGYWTIGQGTAQPVSSLGGHDATAAAALLKAMADLHCDRDPVLLCVYDAPIPFPLSACRPVPAAFALALVLVPDDAHAALGRITAAYADKPDDDSFLPHAAQWRDLARGNPAAQLLRLAESIARRQPDRFALPYLDARLEIGYAP